MKFTLSLLLLVFAFFAVSCSDESSNTKTVTVENAGQRQPPATIAKAQFGDKWIFKIDEGLLECRGENSIGEIVLTSGGKTYAINGVAKQSGKYAPTEEILLDNSKAAAMKNDLSPFINEGLKMCKK